MFKVSLCLVCNNLGLARLTFMSAFAPSVGMRIELCRKKYCSPFDVMRIKAVTFNLPDNEFTCHVVVAQDEHYLPSFKDDMKERGWELVEDN